MVQMAREAAAAGVPALIFSLEMSKEEVVQRFLVATGNISSEQIYMAKVDDWTEFEAGVAKVCDLPIYVDDSTRTLADIEPYKIDNNRIIPQVIDAIRTYDFRLVRAITAFKEALNIPYVDPELIHMHARQLRLIGAALGGKIEWLIRFMEGKRPEV